MEELTRIYLDFLYFFIIRRFHPSAVKILGVGVLEDFERAGLEAGLLFLEVPTSFLKAFLNISHPYLGLRLYEI